jgi:hypothetical protein
VFNNLRNRNVLKALRIGSLLSGEQYWNIENQIEAQIEHETTHFATISTPTTANFCVKTSKFSANDRQR